MDVPLNTYKSLLLRGTRQLREILGPRLAGSAAADDMPVAQEVASVPLEPTSCTGRDNGRNPVLASRPPSRVPVDREPVEIAAEPD
jgi:hypothetical protein